MQPLRALLPLLLAIHTAAAAATLTTLKGATLARPAKQQEPTAVDAVPTAVDAVPTAVDAVPTAVDAVPVASGSVSLAEEYVARHRTIGSTSIGKDGMETDTSRQALKSRHTVAEGSAEGSSTRLLASLQSQLFAAQRVQHRLRVRLGEVRRSARRDSAHLRRQLHRVAEAARRAKEELQAKLQKAEAATATTSDAALQSQLEEAKRAAAQQSVAAVAAARENAALQVQLAEEERALSEEKAELEKTHNAYSELQAGATMGASTESAYAASAKRQLLDQIAELKQREQEARQHAAATQSQVDELRSQLQLHDSDHRAAVAALEAAKRAAEANATAASSAAEQVRRELDGVGKVVAKKEQQLKLVLTETNDLRAARDAATQGETAFQRMEEQAEVQLAQMRKQLEAAQSSLREAEDGAASSEQQAKELSQQRTSLEAQVQQLQKKDSDAQVQLKAVQKLSAAREAKEQEELHSTMLRAVSKVHELEDQRESLGQELQHTKSALTAASAEGAKAKDTLLQETDAALRASQRAESLAASLHDAEEAAKKSGSQVDSLKSQVAELVQQRDRTLKALAARSRMAESWHAKADELDATASKSHAEAKTAEAENQVLRSQVSELSVEAQSADALASQLADLRAASKQKADQEAWLQAQVERLRDLKDRYSAEYETSRNESETWESKAKDLAKKLKSVQRAREVIAKQRVAALERVRTAREQEDEYFEENTRLQQQNEALIQQLKDATSASNSSAQHAHTLETQVAELKEEEAREQQISHAAWVANERELLQARRDVRLAATLQESTQADLMKTRSVLTDAQRRVLGLPAATPPQEKAAAAAAAAVPAMANPSVPVSRKLGPVTALLALGKAELSPPPRAASTPAPVVAAAAAPPTLPAAASGSRGQALPTPAVQPQASLGAAATPAAATTAMKRVGAAAVAAAQKRPVAPAAPLPAASPVAVGVVARLPVVLRAVAAAAPTPAAARPMVAAAAVASVTLKLPQGPGAPLTPQVGEMKVVTSAAALRRTVVQSNPKLTAQNQRKGTAATSLASVAATEAQPAATGAQPQGARSTLEKLAEFFASPLT